MAEQEQNRKPLRHSAESGQALLEYALILILVVVALAAALIATGPALGNVFSNTVYNLIGQNGTPQQDLEGRGGPTAFWLTVTAVATNPPSDRAVPTNPPAPPVPTNTPGPSPTPTPVTPTLTPSHTPTVTISPTPTDIGHDAPFVDPIDNPEWWRVDSSVWLGGDDWLGYYYPNRTLTPPAEPGSPRYNGQVNAQSRFNINFNWGAGGPLSGWLSNDFSVRWTRNVYVFGTNPLTVNFSILSDEGVRLCVNSVAADQACTGPKLIDQWGSRTFDSGPLTATHTFLPSGGATADTVTRHTITLEYYEATGNAGVIMDISSFKGNVLADHANPSGPADCRWARATGSQPNTISWAWEESPLSGNGFPPNMTCNLELRGYVDLANLGNTPQMTFWEVWDFTAAATSRIMIAEYVPYNPDGTGGPNWGAATTIPLRSGGKNYAWTQNTIPIPPALAQKKITYRIELSSTSATGVRRYYIDDIEIRDPNTRMFQVYCSDAGACPDGTNFNLDTTGQKNNFILTGRWDLTSTNTAENSPLSFDVSKTSGGTYVRFGPEQGSGDLRIHAVEFNGEIDLRGMAADGTGGPIDFEGDDGYPQITFHHAYALDTGDSIELQWTRDLRDAVPDNWQTLTSFATATTAPMNQISVLLNTIPSWNTTPFRLRFAFKVNNSANNRAGWFIDNIMIDRKGRPRFGSYPFCDDAENNHNQWFFTGQWGEATTGVFGSSRSFTDSPNGNYIVGQETAAEQRYVIDYNNDTPENFVAPNNGNRDCAGNPSGAAVKPFLTFWHYRSLGSSHNISVDLFRPSNAASGTTQINWSPIWTYTYNSTTRTQLAWERIQIDIQSSIELLTGQTWAALTSNANKYDDDFMFRVRLDTRSGSGQGDGIYVDSFNLRNYTESSHKLWEPSDNVTVPATEPPAGPGEGVNYVDDIDTPTEWWLRWQTGGEWTAIDWDRHSGLRSFHDHADEGTTYKDKQLSILEMNEIIDLRGAKTTDQPTLYFWQRYAIGDGDAAGVQVAVEDKTRTTQNYDFIRGWGSAASYGASAPNNSSWQVMSTATIPQRTRVDTWVRQQVDLSSFADNPATTTVNEGRRIRIRFVLNTYATSSGLAQGWWIDDVVVKYPRLAVQSIPFFDAAQNTSNWVREGIWGLAPDLWRGAGGGPAALGSDPYDAFYFDCIRWATNNYNPPAPVTPPGGANDLNTTSCDPGNTDRFLNSVPRVQTLPGANNDIADWLAARPSFPRLTGMTSTINYDFGTTGRPPGAPVGSAGNTWDNDYMGRWFRDITVQAGDFTFITTSDDAVRLRYDTLPPSTPTTGSTTWNIINNWSFHGRTIDIGTVTLPAGTHQLILEWFESTGGATIILQVGNNNFSFSDSPKGGVAATFPIVNSVPYGNSSLILDKLIGLDLPTGMLPANWKPRLQYYTYYQLGSSATARAEISVDGGFTWTTNNLSANCVGGGANCDPIIYGWSDWMPNNGDWQLRSHDLRSFANRNIGIRFRLNTTSSVRDGWWITEIEVNN